MNMAGAKRTQRVEKMIAGYIEDWESGMPPKEIAEKYEVSYQTVYSYLQEIADNYNKKVGENDKIKRGDLLEAPQLSVEKSSPKSPLRREHVQAEELRDQFVALDEQLAKTIQTLKVLLEENNENNKC